MRPEFGGEVRCGRAWRLVPRGTRATLPRGGIDPTARVRDTPGQRQARGKVTRIIAVSSQKGGVGKTTTTVNLASFLADAGHPSLVIDLDPQANATAGLSCESPEVHPLKVLRKDPRAWERVAVYTPQRNLFLIPSRNDPDHLQYVEGLNAESILELREELLHLREPYEYVLVDTAPTLGPLTMLGLQLADSVLIPVQCEYFALESLAQMLPMVEAAVREQGRRLHVEGVLITMFDRDQNLSYEVASEVERRFPAVTLRTIIPRDMRLAEAQGHGVPISQYDIRARGAWAYLNLAKEILDHGSEQKARAGAGFIDSKERRAGRKRGTRDPARRPQIDLGR